MGGYSLIKMNKSAGGNDGGICELFSAGVKNEKQFSSVTLLAGEKITTPVIQVNRSKYLYQ